MLKLPPVLLRRYILTPLIKSTFKECGKNFLLGRNNDIKGLNNITIGDNVAFGPDQRIWTTGAQVIIGNDVMFGPGVTIISGDHRTDIPGKPMRDVGADEKLPENDQDIVVGNDVWIGANVVILKGVTISSGSVVAAGAVVTKSLNEPNCIWGGFQPVCSNAGLNVMS